MARRGSARSSAASCAWPTIRAPRACGSAGTTASPGARRSSSGDPTCNGQLRCAGVFEHVHPHIGAKDAAGNVIILTDEYRGVAPAPNGDVWFGGANRSTRFRFTSNAAGPGNYFQAQLETEAPGAPGQPRRRLAGRGGRDAVPHALAAQGGPGDRHGRDARWLGVGGERRVGTGPRGRRRRGAGLQPLRRRRPQPLGPRTGSAGRQPVGRTPLWRRREPGEGRQRGAAGDRRSASWGSTRSGTSRRRAAGAGVASGSRSARLPAGPAPLASTGDREAQQGAGA